MRSGFSDVLSTSVTIRSVKTGCCKSVTMQMSTALHSMTVGLENRQQCKGFCFFSLPYYSVKQVIAEETVMRESTDQIKSSGQLVPAP